MSTGKKKEGCGWHPTPLAVNAAALMNVMARLGSAREIELVYQSQLKLEI